MNQAAGARPLLLPAPAQALAPAEPWGLRAVRCAYYAFILSIPIETIVYYQDTANPNSTISLSRMLGYALLALAVTQWKHCFRKLPLAFWLLLWYVAVNAASQLWIPAEMMGRFHAQQETLLQMTGLFLLSVNLLSDNAFRQRVFRAYGWWMVLVAIGMLSGVFGMDIGGGVQESRDSLITQDPNAAAALFTLAAIAIAGDTRLLEGRRRLARAAVSTAGVLILAASVLRTGSRGGLIAFGCGFGALALCGGKRTRKARLLAASFVLGLTTLLVRIEFARGTSTAARIERTWDEGDTAGRTEIYDQAWEMFLQKPAFGWGGGNNRYVLGANLNYPDRDTHNTFLHVLTEVGVFGAWGFFAMLLYALFNGWRAGRRMGDAVPFALVVAILVVNSSITGIREKIFWIVLAAAVASGLRSAKPPEAGGAPARA